jgi:hypothetical protein
MMMNIKISNNDSVSPRLRVMKIDFRGGKLFTQRRGGRGGKFLKMVFNTSLFHDFIS